MARAARTFPVELPEETVGDRPEASVAEELLLLWVIESVRQGRVSTGRAARAVGMPLARFLREASAHGLAVLDAEPGEIADEVGLPT